MSLKFFMKETPRLNFSHPLIQEVICEARGRNGQNNLKNMEELYYFVRYNIKWGPRLGPSASEVLEYREGCCVAASMLLIALYRGCCIPAGFSFQTITREDGNNLLHGITSFYNLKARKWVHCDPRENNVLEFSTDENRLLYPEVKIDGVYADLPPVFYPFEDLYPIDFREWPGKL